MNDTAGGEVDNDGLITRRQALGRTVLLSGGALLFSAYLTYLELFVIHAICRWCVGSAVIITAIFVLSLLDARRAHRPVAG